MSPTVLIAEDDRVARELLAGCLQAAGFTCWETDAESAAIEVAVLRPQATIVGLGVTRDVALRLAHALSDQPNPTAVIVLSRPDLDFAIEATDAGAFDCLVWPASPRGLVDSVTRAVGHRTTGDRVAHRRAVDEDFARQCEFTNALRTIRTMAVAQGLDVEGYLRRAGAERVRCS